MASAHDVAALIGQRKSSVSAQELHKLLYYAQAWSLVWDGEPLFDDRLEAWVDGPVARAIWADRKYHSLHYGDPGRLSKEQIDTVDAVLDFYGSLSGRQLVQLSHREAPWRDARAELEPWEKSQNQITPEALQAYFLKLAVPGEKRVPDAARRGAWVLLQTPEHAVSDMFTKSEKSDAFTSWLEADEDRPWDD